MLAGTYMVWGEGLSPQVHVLTAEQSAAFAERSRIIGGPDSKHWEQCLRLTFGAGVDGAVMAYPCSGPGLEWLALSYEGPHQSEVRGIAAALALGQPIGGDAKRKPASGPDNGAGGVPAKPSKPKAPKGGAPANFYATLNTGG